MGGMRTASYRGVPTTTLLLLVATSLLAIWLGFASRADAAFEQLAPPNGNFGGSGGPLKEGEKFSEEVQLGGTAALAVNRSGAGGVPAGTVYAIRENAPSGEPQVAMYTPKAGGGLEFAERWDIKSTDPYERCGPYLGTEVVEGKTVAEHPCSKTQSTGAEAPYLGLDVDQTTGFVYTYAFSISAEVAGSKVITSYTADGAEVKARFGEWSPGPIAATASSSHYGSFPDSLAVSPDGDVYLYDTGAGSTYHRLMVFSPQGGDLTKYAYAGEIAGGSNQLHEPRGPVFDDAGNLYVATLSTISNFIEALPKETPGPYPTLAAAPRCEAKVKGGGAVGMTVDPASGTVYYSTIKHPGEIFQIGSCSEQDHQFSEAAAPEAFVVTPPASYVYGLAVDPDRVTASDRPHGALYAAAVHSDEFGNEFSTPGYVLARPVAQDPAILSESVSHVTASDAVVSAKLDPNGHAARYTVQVLPQSTYEANGHSFEGASESPLGGGVAQPSGGLQQISVSVGPLDPETSYVYRVVASSECASGGPPCQVEGEAKQFRTFPAATVALPDGRAWELVSPAQKNAGQVLPAAPNIKSCGEAGCSEDFSKPGGTAFHFPMQSAPAGDAVSFEGTNFGSGGGILENQYIARRDPAAGWQVVNPTPALFNGGSYESVSLTLGAAVFEQSGVPLVPGAPSTNLYVQATNSPFVPNPILVADPAHRTPDQLRLQFAGASPDASRIYFSANDALTADAEDGGTNKLNLYEWQAGQIALVNVLPGGETEAGVSIAPPSANPVSVDGSRVFFSTAGGQVFLREGGNTVQIPGGGKFLSAAENGRRALLSNGYLYDVESAGATDLTEGKGGFQGLLGQDDDLDVAYFIDTAVLGVNGDKNAQGQEPQLGANNLYVWKVGEPAHFVAKLAVSDNEPAAATGPTVVDWATNPANRTAEASPNGRYLAFGSRQPLTGYDNVGPCTQVSITGNVPKHYVAGRCPEAYLYDSKSDQLICASCNPTGASPLGWTVLRRNFRGENFPQPRYLTDDGRFYFDTEDSLSPRDTNDGVEDVYQWEPSSVGGCESGFSSGGCVSLISGGRGPSDSNLVTVNEGGPGAPGGLDVFFTTRDRLAPRDRDDLIDLYDARKGGGFASETELKTTECQGETCQPPVTAPNDPTPGSASFQGPGNVKEGSAKTKKPRKHKHKKRRHGTHHKTRSGRHQGGSK